MKKNIIVYLFMIVLFSSCASVKRVSYFQDMKSDSITQTVPTKEIKLKPNDRISITVNSKDQKLSSLFNLAIVTNNTNVVSSASSDETSAPTITARQGISKYTIDNAGNIDFPVMGSLHVQGLTRDSLEKFIKRQLMARQLLTDAVVTVEFDNLYVSVLGEVRNAGRFIINRDCFTVIDAISMAGDLTMNGNRRNVLVVRQEGNKQKSYRINLCSAAQTYSSPAYYLQQNDIVYVEPRHVRSRK